MVSRGAHAGNDPAAYNCMLCTLAIPRKRRNRKKLGREAGRRLIDLIAGKEFRGVRRIPCTLVIRESGGARSRAAGNTTGGI